MKEPLVIHLDTIKRDEQDLCPTCLGARVVFGIYALGEQGVSHWGDKNACRCDLEESE